jgi:hypothetical protein
MSQSVARSSGNGREMREVPKITWTIDRSDLSVEGWTPFEPSL